MENEDIDMSYIAGVMDGDGSFSLCKLQGCRNTLYFPLLQCSTWRSFIDFLKEKIGGNIVTGKVHICKDGTEGHALKRWRLRSHENVRPVLEKLIPFLRIKKERAQFLLNYIIENPFKRGHVLTSEDLVRRERAHLQMVNFNEWKSCDSNISLNLAKIMTEDKLFWSYIAGLMDTDGSFSLKRQKINKGTDVKNPRYLPVIAVSMTDVRSINYLRENCNIGKLYIPKNSDTSAGYHYQFGIYTKLESVEFLKRVIPFLKSKKEQAEVLLDFCMNSKNTKYCKIGISADELAFREDCYQRMIQLNKYGVFKPSLIGLETQNWVTRRKQRDACSVID
jgi:hypothetical protein